MKIYTRTGDDGSTGLIGGQRVRKSDPRIDCCGVIDELNAILGWAAVAADAALRARLQPVQDELFVIGSHLAAPDGAAGTILPPLDESAIAQLETQIDAAQATLPPLRHFILPGGGELAARLHVARTVCRRAERALVAFAHDYPLEPLIVVYLNRLSDWLFVQARLANHTDRIDDVPWRKP